ncbi:MAG TPA: sulfur carrier protein ThiS [Rickettsiales bacterium]|nr:sulfur carrier protein ThiS [Rickettsiales bacterium]
MSKIKIILNGEEKILAQKTTIADLINDLDLDIKKIAIEKDLEIIDIKNFTTIILEDGNKIEIVHFIGGG